MRVMQKDYYLYGITKFNAMKVQFCGAAREVTGSAHLLTLDDGFTILLDCGLYQGRSEEMEKFNENWFFEPSEIDCMILSHAHIDHSGRIPKLVKDGFKGNIYCTHATRSLANIMLLDAAKIQEKDTEYYNEKVAAKKNKPYRVPLYLQEDVDMAIQQFIGCNYEHWFSIRTGLELLFKDAGHILGSASVTLKITKSNGEEVYFGFSGDIGRPSRPILKDPQPMPKLDYLISESTYGNKEHEEAPAEKSRFLRIIKETCIEKNGKLLIPAFSIGRTQEVVYILDQLETEGMLPHIPVFVDSPLSVNATELYKIHRECFDKEINDYLIIDDNPFGFNNLRYIRKLEDSKAINELKGPCIIISASGMMNAGRVKHHLAHIVENELNTILIVGYCTPDTPGGKLRDGKKTIKLFGEIKKVKAKVEVMDSFSAHADRLELMDYLKNQRDNLKKLFLVHGEYKNQKPFAASLEKIGFKNIEIPALSETFDLS